MSILHIKNAWQRAATRAALSLMIAVGGFGAVAAPAEPVRPPTPAGWFHIYPLDEHTYAISEPKYWQENVSYLLIGTRRALLFDTGPGIYSIRAAVVRRCAAIWSAPFPSCCRCREAPRSLRSLP
jgi:hypothetical protein